MHGRNLINAKSATNEHVDNGGRAAHKQKSLSHSMRARRNDELTRAFGQLHEGGFKLPSVLSLGADTSDICFNDGNAKRSRAARLPCPIKATVRRLARLHVTEELGRSRESNGGIHWLDRGSLTRMPI